MPARTKTRYGSQDPTKSVYLNRKRDYTLATDAIELYKRTGRTPQPWQISLLNAILSVDREGIYIHSKFGYSVPRRNGKNEVIAMRELYGLTIGEKILHTAHRTSTSTSAYERLLELIKLAGYVEGDDFTTSKARGAEKIVLFRGNGKKDGIISFRTRTTRGGLGEGFDVLIVDEAQEYTEDMETTLKPLVTDSRNPQTIMSGTPPTQVSAGTVFPTLRKNALAGTAKYTGWAEWSVDEMSDVHNIDLWYQTNPALGYQLNERKIEVEITSNDLDFNIQRLGLWIEYNLKSAITANEWDTLKVPEVPALTGSLNVGIKFGHDGNNVAVTIAANTTDNRVFIETIDCRSIRVGTGWIIDFLKQIDRGLVVIDGANGQSILEEEMRAARLKPPPILPKTQEIINAGAAFERCMNSGELCHTGQPSLKESATNCDKRPIGANGGFGYKSLREDIDVAILESAVLATWACLQCRKINVKSRIR